MSDNNFNTIVSVPPDPNTYFIDDLKIEFKKTYKKEYNEINSNRLYKFMPLYNTNNIYLPVEFSRKDTVGYIKLKDKELWFQDDGKNIYFDVIRFGDYNYKQPKIIWFQYTREQELIVFKFLGSGVESILKKEYNGLTNMSYLNYSQDKDKVYMKWVDDVNDATKFIYDKIKWDQMSWIKLYDTTAQKKF